MRGYNVRICIRACLLPRFVNRSQQATNQDWLKILVNSRITKEDFSIVNRFESVYSTILFILTQKN